jgi:hypothetical protein
MVRHDLAEADIMKLERQPPHPAAPVLLRRCPAPAPVQLRHAHRGHQL